MPTRTKQCVQPNHATANDCSMIAELQKRLQTNAKLPIKNPSLGHKIQQHTKKQSQLTLSSLLLACTKCKRRFEDKRSLTQHQRKSTTCRSQTALSVNVDLVDNKELLPPDLLAFSRVNPTKHPQALAKNPPAKANLVQQQPQSDNTGTAKTTGPKLAFGNINGR